MFKEPALMPYIVTQNAAQAIDFYTKSFAATELFRLTGPDGKVGHAELQMGDSKLMLADEYPDFGALSPVTIGGTPVTLHMYVSDVDAVFKAAVDNGATELRKVQDQFYGDRVGWLLDPFGHKWSIATRIEEVTPQEMQRRWSEAMAQGGAGG
jgi:PhnB protein